MMLAAAVRVVVGLSGDTEQNSSPRLVQKVALAHICFAGWGWVVYRFLPRGGVQMQIAKRGYGPAAKRALCENGIFGSNSFVLGPPPLLALPWGPSVDQGGGPLCGSPAPAAQTVFFGAVLQR